MPDLTAAPEPQEGGAPVEGEANAAVSTSAPPDYVRNSPEYQALQRELRAEARRRGSAEAELAKARAAAESARQAAEAQAEAARQAEIEAILGTDGVAFWNEFAELSVTNPTEAARRLREFQAKQAQSSPATEPATTLRPAEPPQEGQMQQQTPLRAVGEAPLGQRTDEPSQLIAALEADYNAVVQRNLDPATRNRVTMKDRANGLISYLLAAYTKAGAKPKNG